MDITSWLKDLGLERYAEAFLDNDIDARILPTLSADDLKELGVTSLGHRKQLLEAIAALQEPAHRTAGGAQVGPPVAPPREAERRQLTVLFCDLVGSTKLAARLDPEDMGQVIGAYQGCCTELIERWGGQVAKYMGDGVLAYFGWPQAHEDEAERAVRAGLELVEAVSALDTPGLSLGGGRHERQPLTVRVGIATGLVMVGELIGAGSAQEETVVGETPNLAARLQALAAPGSVVISQATRRLVGGLFELADLGPRRIKGFAEPLAAFRVEGEGGAEGRFEALHGERLTPLVGREHELGILLERWAWAKDGEGQVVLLSGEPGIGKSRLLRALREQLTREPYTPLSHYCSPYHTNSALYPVIALLERAAGLAPEDGAEQRLDRLEALLTRSTERLPETVPLVAALLSLPTGKRYPPLELSPQQQKQRTLAILVDQLAGLAARQPVLAMYEDAHWVDPTTLELLDLVIERVRRLPVLIVITYRPEFIPPWSGEAHVTALPLNRLGRRQGATIVERLTGGKALPDEVLDQILAKTDGVPLFVEELTKTVLESSLLTDAGDHYELTGPLPPLAIPATLHDSLMARLDRLAPVKEVAQIGAVIGREFSHELLAAVSPLSEADLNAAVEQLVTAELIFRRGTLPTASYTFKHALVQDAAYQSLLKSRRQQLHARIAQALEENFSRTAEVAPEVLAHHLTEAGLSERAVPYWYRAGEQASQRSASIEAVAHLTKGLTLLRTLPESENRARRELELQLALGPPLIQTRGYAAAEVEASYLRARELCLQLDEPSQFFTASFGLWILHVSRMELGTARGFVDELLTVARRERDPGLLLQAHHVAWTTFFYAPEQPACLEHAEQSLMLYDRERHVAHKHVYGGHDPGVCGRNYRAMSSALLGYADRAVDGALEAVTLASELKHQFSLVLAFACSALVHQFRRDPKSARKLAESAMALCAEHGIAPQYLATARIIRGWSIAIEENPGNGAHEIRDGLDALKATGVGLRRSYCLALLAEACQRTGDFAAGLAALAEALEFMDTTGERWWEAEVHRLRGELLVVHGGAARDQAGTYLKRALDIARLQNLKALELRAATSLARLWAEQGERQKARDLLAPIYGWFTEGFDTADLKDAKALLDQLA